MHPSPTPEEILSDLRRERPRGWRSVTPAHAERLAVALARRSEFGAVASSEDALLAEVLDEQAVGSLLGLAMGFVARWLLTSAIRWTIRRWQQKG